MTTTTEKLSLAQAAKYLGMCPPTLRKFALSERRITCIKYGSRIFFRVEDLENFKTQNTFPAQKINAVPKNTRTK